MFGNDIFAIISVGGTYGNIGAEHIHQNTLTFNGDILTFNGDILTYTE